MTTSKSISSCSRSLSLPEGDREFFIPPVIKKLRGYRVGLVRNLGISTEANPTDDFTSRIQAIKTEIKIPIAPRTHRGKSPTLDVRQLVASPWEP
jgi:hypothetical protein